MCACQNRYYDAGTSTATCSACQSTCLTCNGALITNCLSCNTAVNRVYNSSTNKCDCNVGYYGSTTV